MHRNNNTSARHVFLSFKTEQRDSAFRLRSALTRRGFTVWWQEEIQCGREWHGEVDAAVEAASCIVVLWSEAAMASPWVRHEASQAIVRGVYAPARLQAMEIGSPYNRIQATDLIGWTGDENHPGFQNLVARILELIPPPRTRKQIVFEFLARHRGVIVTGALAIGAFALLFRMAVLLDAQLKQQAQIATEIQRTLQPIKDVQVSAFVEVDPATPGLAAYVQMLRSQAPLNALPAGAFVARSGPQGVEEIAITAGSGLWPTREDPSWLFYVLQYVELSLKFNVTPSAVTGAAEKSDLSFNVGSHDPDGSEGPRGNSAQIGWEPKTGKITLHFSDTPIEKWWESNGNVVSVPDLEKSTLTISFLSVMVPRLDDDQVAAALLKSRAGLRLSSLFLTYSGRKIQLRGSEMRETTDPKGLRQYTIPLTSETIRKLKAALPLAPPPIA